MTISIIKRLMDGLGLTHEEAQAYYASMQVTCAVENLVPEVDVVATKWRGCVGGVYVAGVAAQYGGVHIRNYPGSGVLVVVDRITAWSAAAGNLELWEDAAGYGSVSAQKGFRDQAITGTPAAQIRTMNNVAHQGDTLLGTLASGASIPSVLEGPFILDGGVAGQAIGFEHQELNVALGALFEWRERDYNPAA
jgi:hypothetical protein